METGLKLEELDLTCSFYVRYTQHGYDNSGPFERYCPLNILIGKMRPITNKAEAIRKFNKWCKKHAKTDFKERPVLYQEKIIARF